MASFVASLRSGFVLLASLIVYYKLVFGSLQLFCLIINVWQAMLIIVLLPNLAWIVAVSFYLPAFWANKTNSE
jgi:hypothetical protein